MSSSLLIGNFDRKNVLGMQTECVFRKFAYKCVESSNDLEACIFKILCTKSTSSKISDESPKKP